MFPVRSKWDMQGNTHTITYSEHWMGWNLRIEMQTTQWNVDAVDRPNMRQIFCESTQRSVPSGFMVKYHVNAQKKISQSSCQFFFLRPIDGRKLVNTPYNQIALNERPNLFGEDANVLSWGEAWKGSNSIERRYQSRTPEKRSSRARRWKHCSLKVWVDSDSRELRMDASSPLSSKKMLIGYGT